MQLLLFTIYSATLSSRRVSAKLTALIRGVASVGAVVVVVVAAVRFHLGVAL